MTAGGTASMFCVAARVEGELEGPESWMCPESSVAEALV